MATQIKRRLQGSSRLAGELVWLLATLIVSHLSLAILAAFAAMYLFVWLAFNVFQGATQRFDTLAMDYFQHYKPEWMHDVMLVVTRLADWGTITVVTVAAVVGFSLAKRLWPDGITLLVAAVGGWGVIEGLKLLFARSRPELGLYEAVGYSFPSGHSFFVVTIYGMLAYRLSLDAPRWRRTGIWALVVVLILLVGSSRVFLGVHYPTDVTGGFLAGIFWLWGCLAIPRFRKVTGWGAYRERRIGEYRHAKEQLAALDSERTHLRTCVENIAEHERRLLPRVALRCSVLFGKLFEKRLRRISLLEKTRLDMLVYASALHLVDKEALTACWGGGRPAAEVLETLAKARRNLLGA